MFSEPLVDCAETVPLTVTGLARVTFTSGFVKHACQESENNVEWLPGQPHMLLIKYPKDNPSPSGNATAEGGNCVVKSSIGSTFVSLGHFANAEGRGGMP